MNHLSNQLLIETYIKAVRLGLDHVFIRLILDEFSRRTFTDEELLKIADIEQGASLHITT